MREQREDDEGEKRIETAKRGRRLDVDVGNSALATIKTHTCSGYITLSPRRRSSFLFLPFFVRAFLRDEEATREWPSTRRAASRHRMRRRHLVVNIKLIGQRAQIAINPEEKKERKEYASLDAAAKFLESFLPTSVNQL